MLNNSIDIFKIIIFLILPFVGLLVGFAIGTYRRRAIEYRLENRGEALVRRALKEYCKNKNAHLLNCVTLRLEDGSTTQIDHILICTKGIFVIETKHYTGWIFGNPKAKLWTQFIYKNKYTFQNPLFQNYRHIKEIERILDFLERPLIHNIVVFTGDSVFKTNRIDNVYNTEELIPAIENCADGALSLNRIQFCVGRLEYMRLELTRKTDIEHHEYLMQKFNQ